MRPALRAPLPSRPSPAFLDAERAREHSTGPGVGGLSPSRRWLGSAGTRLEPHGEVPDGTRSRGRGENDLAETRANVSGRERSVGAALRNRRGDTGGRDHRTASANHGGAVAALRGPSRVFRRRTGTGPGGRLSGPVSFRPRARGRLPPAWRTQRSWNCAAKRWPDGASFTGWMPDGGVAGFAANEAWIEGQRAQVQAELGVANPQARDLRLHAGAVAVVSLLLSAGVLLLARDSSREARINDLRTAFVSGVSHELKTPITLVRLYGETLLRHEGLSPEERRDFYRIITRESTRLGRLVDQILSFSRIEQGELEVRHEGRRSRAAGRRRRRGLSRVARARGFRPAADRARRRAAGVLRSRRGLAGTGQPSRQRGQVFRVLA